MLHPTATASGGVWHQPHWPCATTIGRQRESSAGRPALTSGIAAVQGWQLERPSAGRRPAMNAITQAGPTPVFRSVDKTGPQRVCLDVADDVEILRRSVDDERVVAPLIDVAMPNGVRCTSSPGGMNTREALQKPAEFIGGLGPHHQVPVVGHQDIRQKPHRDVVANLFNQSPESAVRGVVVEEAPPVVSTVDDVEDAVVGKRALLASHEAEPRGTVEARTTPAVERAAIGRRWHDIVPSVPDPNASGSGATGGDARVAAAASPSGALRSAARRRRRCC